jgi:uncharacterized protein YndB with AHSA1/START domain
LTITPLFHGSFTINRSWDAPPSRVFAAWSDPELKAVWFSGPPDQWTVLRRSIDFRPGGAEVLEGRFIQTGMVSLYEGRIHLIEPNERLVLTYDMHVNGAYHSVSLASLALKPQGAGTLLTYTEQIVFVDGKDGTDARRSGTEALFDRIAATALSLKENCISG